MKRIHIRKPDIKGFFTKVRNLKKEDIKRHFKEKKERRQRILEERRNSRFAKKMQPVYKWMNRLSLPLQFLLACVINFLIETVSRLSFFEAWDYLTGTPLVFLYNSFMIFVTFMIVYLFRRRVFARILISVFWLFLGICNGYLLTKRVTPFNAQDLKVLSDALELTGNYFNTFELVMIIIGVVAVVFWVVSMWRRGGQFTGKMHRVIALFGVGISFAACLWLTDVAIDKRVISNYFGNIAFAYEDYGFPYCFSSSLFNTGINEPAGYSEETMKEISGNGVTAKVDGVDVAAGNSKLMDRLGVKWIDCHQAGTIIHMAVDGRYAGHIVISDIEKPHAKEAVMALKKAGVEKTVMLTGDSRKVAEHVAEDLGIDEVHAELLPADKVSEVEELLKKNTGKGKLAFVGDGINDAPVLSRADIGIAMGAMGSDAAIEAADIVLMDDDPLKIAKAIRISRKCLRIVYENIWFAIGIKLICLVLGAIGIANMWLAIFADVGVMIIAVLNAIRALFVKKL